MEGTGTTTRIDWYILAKTKTGGKIHKAPNNGSRTFCGSRVTGRIEMHEGNSVRNLCDKCFKTQTEMNFDQYKAFSVKTKMIWGDHGELAREPYTEETP